MREYFMATSANIDDQKIRYSKHRFSQAEIMRHFADCLAQTLPPGSVLVSSPLMVEHYGWVVECNGLHFALLHADGAHAVFQISRMDKNDKAMISPRYIKIFDALGLRYLGQHEFHGDLPEGGYGIDMAPPHEYGVQESPQTHIVTVEWKGLAKAMGYPRNLEAGRHERSLTLECAKRFDPQRSHEENLADGTQRYQDYLERRGKGPQSDRSPAS